MVLHFYSCFMRESVVEIETSAAAANQLNNETKAK